MPSSRRAVLASVAAGFAGVAGCLSGGSGGSGSAGGDDTPAPSETTEPATDRALGDTHEGDGYTVTLVDAAARKSVLSYYAPDAFGVETAPSGERFAFVGVETTGEGPPVESFRFLAGEESFEPTQVSRDVRRDFAPVMDGPYDPSGQSSDGTGWVAFAVPASLSADLGVSVDGAAWSLPESAAAPFRDPVPEFEMGTVSIPDAVDADEAIPVSVEFENAGDGDGTLRGALNHYGPMHGASAFRLDVAAGGAETWETTIDYHLDDDVDTEVVQFEVATTAGNVSREVTIRGGGTPTGDGTADGTATSTATYSLGDDATAFSTN